jgi:transposase
MEKYIGLDIHRKFVQACVMDADGDVLDERRLELADPEEVIGFFGGFDGDSSEVVMEATIGWMWLADVLEEQQIPVHLAHMAGCKVIAESRCSTDKVDAHTLAELLRVKFLPEAYLAPRELREMRMILRHREGMMQWRTAAKNKVHALLARYNIHLPGADIFGARGMMALRELQLRPTARRVLSDLLDVIEYLNPRIRSVEKWLYDHLGPDPRVGWLTSLPGVGKLTAHFLISEIGTIDRFASPSKLVNYCGLCPSTKQSASRTWHGSTKGSGRRLLKWCLVEAAHTAVRRDPYFARTYHRLAKRRGTGKAYVTVARKMARIIWQMLKEGRPYHTGTRQPRVGSSRAMKVDARC